MQSLRLIGEWLSECSSKHSLCIQHGNAARLPKRLLEIRSASDDTVTHVRLVDTSSLPPETPYFTLSHRWGQHDHFRLLQDNVDQLAVSVPLTKLSPVFLDAASVPLHFGCQYIWIDALCIMQDNKSDWAEQATEMGSIFQHATCNIAAIEAIEEGQGCFFDRPTQLVAPLRISDSDGDPLHDVYVTCDNKVYEDIIEAPLHKRGWVFQERLLAPRTLHFGKKQIYWECREKVANETFNKSLLASDLANLHQDLKRTLSNPEPRDTLRRLDQWGLVVEDYCLTDLTVPEDKLIAIAGIANTMRSSFGASCAGLWRDFLPAELLWRVAAERTANDSVSGSRLHEHRAPSWSWASVDGPVSYHEHTLAALSTPTLVVVTAIDLWYPKVETRGQIVMGTLHIFGKIFSVKTSQEDMNISSMAEGVLPKDGGADGKIFGRVYPDDVAHARARRNSLWALPVYSESDKLPSYGSLATQAFFYPLVALLLAKHEEGFYQRCGLITFDATEYQLEAVKGLGTKRITIH